MEGSQRPLRRERARIFYDILCSIMGQEEAGIVRITRVQNEVNLPSDRLRQHLKQMSALGLIELDDGLASTRKGREFRAEYGKVANVLRRFGLF